MKAPRILLLVIAALGFIGLKTAAMADVAKSTPAKSSDAQVLVVFQEPEKFTDIKDDSMDTDKGREYILSEIREYIEKQAKTLIAKDQRFEITFTDIDLAGQYEPWRSSSLRDVRIVKDIYPPRFDFSFKILDASGAVIKEGKETLRDLTFMSRMVIDRSDSLRYEKDILKQWMVQTLSAAKKP